MYSTMMNFKTAILAIALFMSALFVLANILPETEPNNSQNTAETIFLNDTLVGQIQDPLDQDWSKITLQQGTYKLFIDYPSAPAVRDWFELMDAAGQVLEHQCYYTTPTTQLIYFKVCEPTQEVYLKAFYNADLGLSGADYVIAYAFDVDDPKECNDSPIAARDVDQPSVLTGKLPLNSDLDFLKINAAAGPFGLSINTPLEPGLRFSIDLYQDANPTPIASVSDANDLNFNLPVSGIYYIAVDYTADTASQHPYLLSLLYEVNLSCFVTIDSAAVTVVPTVCGASTGSIFVPDPVDGTAPFTYLLNGANAQSTGDYTNLPEGSYTISVTDANACTGEIAVNVTCTAPCDPPQVGIVNAFVSGKNVTLSLVQQFVDSISVNYGDGVVSTDLTHTYLTNGDYTVTVTGFNACGSASAVTLVSIRTAKFRIGWVENVAPGSVVQLPIIVEEGNFQWAGVNGGVVTTNLSVADFTEILPGTLHPSQMIYGNNNDLFAGLATPQASEAFEVGDTIFYIAVQVGAGQPGDTIGVDIPDFNFSIFSNGGLQDLYSTMTPGGFILVHDVELRIQIQTPNYLPIPGVEVKIVSPDTTIYAITDAAGYVSVMAPYATDYAVTFLKDTIVTQGINTIDPFLIIRMLVQLQNTGLTIYSYVAADFDCSGSITITDPSAILNFIVGNIVPSCPQYVFIPDYHVFGSYPNPDFFNFPTEYTVTNPNPVAGADVRAVGVIRGDVNHSVIPQLNAIGDDRNGREITCQYQVEERDGQTHVWLSPAVLDKIGGGYLHIGFDAAAFDFQGAHFAQGASQNACVVNDKRKTDGALELAFVNLAGKAIAFDPELPLLELVFVRKTAAADLDFKLIENEKPSMMADELGTANRVVLERMAAPQPENIASDVKIFPSPAHDIAYVNLPTRGHAQVMVFDLSGQLVYSAESTGNWQMEIPVSEWAEGMYLCRIATDGTTIVRKFEVSK